MTVGVSTVQDTVSAASGAEAEGSSAIEWRLCRNCSLAPRQLLRCYLGLSVVCLGIGSLCWWHGATLVMPFAWLEVLALGVALLVYARHAADGECLRLERGMLTVRRECAGRIEQHEFRFDGVRIESRGDGSLVELSGQGRSIAIGRLVRPEARRQLVNDLRREKRRVCQGLSMAGWVGSSKDHVTRR